MTYAKQKYILNTLQSKRYALTTSGMLEMSNIILSFCDDPGFFEGIKPLFHKKKFEDFKTKHYILFQSKVNVHPLRLHL